MMSPICIWDRATERSYNCGSSARAAFSELTMPTMPTMPTMQSRRGRLAVVMLFSIKDGKDPPLIRKATTAAGDVLARNGLTLPVVHQ